MVTNINNNSQTQQIPTSRKIAGAAVGTAIGATPLAYLAYDAVKPFKPEDIAKTQDFMRMIMPPIDSFENTKAVAETIIKNEGLADKGVKLFISNKTPESVAHLDELFKNEKPKGYVNKMKEMFKNGLNACFYPKAKTVIINDEIAHSSVFHELGHAKDFTSKNIFMKALTKGRCLTPMNVSVVAPIALAVAMFHNVDRSKPQDKKGKVEKTLDFISNNAGKLTLASYAPMLAEEGIASARGIKMAKKYLNPKQISMLKGSYKKAFSTYATVALLVSGLVGFGAMLKEGIVNKKRENA